MSIDPFEIKAGKVTKKSKHTICAYEGFATLENPTFVSSILDALGKTDYAVINDSGKVTSLAEVQGHYMFFDSHQNNRHTFLPVCGKPSDAIVVGTGNVKKKLTSSATWPPTLATWPDYSHYTPPRRMIPQSNTLRHRAKQYAARS